MARCSECMLFTECPVSARQRRSRLVSVISLLRSRDLLVRERQLKKEIFKFVADSVGGGVSNGVCSRYLPVLILGVENE